MVEIYKGEMRDLLVPKKVVAADRPKLELRLNTDGHVEIRNVTIRSLHNIDECNDVFEKGLGGRKTRKTLMNDASSRSHLIFSLVIRSTNRFSKKT